MESTAPTYTTGYDAPPVPHNPNATIAEMMERNPEAFVFPERGAFSERMDGSVPATLDQMVGDQAEPIMRGGLVFYRKAPKIKQMRAIMHTANALAQASDAATDIEAIDQVFDRYSALGALLLYVTDVGGADRPATIDEIEEHFELQELIDVVRDATGATRPRAEGN